jgi:hypothetical protein
VGFRRCDNNTFGVLIVALDINVFISVAATIVLPPNLLLPLITFIVIINQIPPILLIHNLRIIFALAETDAVINLNLIPLLPYFFLLIDINALNTVVVGIRRIFVMVGCSTLMEAVVLKLHLCIVLLPCKLHILLILLPEIGAADASIGVVPREFPVDYAHSTIPT